MNILPIYWESDKGYIYMHTYIHTHTHTTSLEWQLDTRILTSCVTFYEPFTKRGTTLLTHLHLPCNFIVQIHLSKWILSAKGISALPATTRSQKKCLHTYQSSSILFPGATAHNGGRASSLSSLHDHTQTHHTLYDSSGQVISPTKRHTTLKRHRNLCIW
jgi:hypothetical protein